MSILINVRTNAPPCKHTVVTVTEDGETRQMVFHDSHFTDKDFMPDVEFKEIFKVIKVRLKGKPLSESEKDFDGFTLTQSLTKEVAEL